MKRREKIMLAIFAVDLFLLLFYNQVREDVRTNFTYKKILFWWFYFYPIAYFMGGYFLSYFILVKSKIVLDKKVQRMLIVLITAVAGVYVLATGAMIVHQFHPFVPHSLGTTFEYAFFTIYPKHVYLFSIVGFLTAVCLFSHPEGRQYEQEEN